MKRFLTIAPALLMMIAIVSANPSSVLASEGDEHALETDHICRHPLARSKAIHACERREITWPPNSNHKTKAFSQEATCCKLKPWTDSCAGNGFLESSNGPRCCSSWSPCLRYCSDPGQSTTLSFVANKPGSFRFRCNVTCGAMHPFMIGKLTVASNHWLYRSIGLAILAIVGVIVSAKQKA